MTTIPDSFDGGPENITDDDDLREFLTLVGLDPVTSPYFCAMEVSKRWGLPIAEASIMVSHLS